MVKVLTLNAHFILRERAKLLYISYKIGAKNIPQDPK